MKAAGFASLTAGWLLALAALVLLPSGAARAAFVAAAVAVEIVGLTVVIRAHIGPGSESKPEPER